MINYKRSNNLTKEIIIRNDMGKNTNSNNGNDNCNSDIDNDTAAANLHMKQASRRVGFMLMLNAWRHCRAQLCDMIQHSVKLESQVGYNFFFYYYLLFIYFTTKHKHGSDCSVMSAIHLAVAYTLIYL